MKKNLLALATILCTALTYTMDTGMPGTSSPGAAKSPTATKIEGSIPSLKELCIRQVFKNLKTKTKTGNPLQEKTLLPDDLKEELLGHKDFPLPRILKKIHSIQGEKENLVTLFPIDENYFATVTNRYPDSEIKIWDVRTGAQVKTINMPWSVTSGIVTNEKIITGLNMATNPAVTITNMEGKQEQVLDPKNPIGGVKAMASTAHVLACIHNKLCTTTLNLWDLKQNKLYNTITKGGGRQFSLIMRRGEQFSSVALMNSNIVIVGNKNGDISWTTNFEEFTEFKNYSSAEVTKIAPLDEKKRIIVSGSSKGQLSLCSINPSKVIKTINAHESSIQHLVILNNLIISATLDEIKVWDNTLKLVQTISTSMPFTDGNDFLIVVGNHVVYTPNCKDLEILSFDFNESVQRAQDNTIKNQLRDSFTHAIKKFKSIDFNTCACAGCKQCPTNRESCVAITPSGQFFAMRFNHKETHQECVGIFETETRNLLHILPSHLSDPISHIVFSDNYIAFSQGRNVLMGPNPNKLKDKVAPVLKHILLGSRVNALELSKDKLFINTEDKRIICKIEKTTPPQYITVRFIAKTPLQLLPKFICPDNKKIIVLSVNKIEWRNLLSNELLSETPLEASPLKVAFDVKHNIAAISVVNEVYLYDYKTTKLCSIVKTEHKQPINELQFSPDSNYLMTGATDGHVFMFDLKSKYEFDRLLFSDALSASQAVTLYEFQRTVGVPLASFITGPELQNLLKKIQLPKLDTQKKQTRESRKGKERER